MDEMTTLDDLGEHLDPAGAPPLTRARMAVLAELAAPASRPRRGVSRRWTVGITATVALTSVAAAAVVLAPVTSVDRRQPLALAGASEILNRAAEAADREPTLTPRPDQYLHIEIRAAGREPNRFGYGWPASLGDAIVMTDPPGRPFSITLRSWLSVDGTRSSLQERKPWNSSRPERWWRPGCLNGREVLPGRPAGRACVTDPAHLSRMPTDALSLRGFIEAIGRRDMPQRPKGSHRPSGESEFASGFRDVLARGYVPPKARAALFRMLAQNPRATVDRDITDPAGRKGVGVTLYGQEMIFDARTYRYLGVRATLPAKTRTYSTIAITNVAIVDRPAQPPRP
ncbi:CU044_5270 family protein [Thermomonospora umbrina]|uniref:CU044_5270 family protein n=1 Tax=Thermomonospora umbrina TaxID=111806 RepID=A0A3D9T683_9ACTN|nr:CU044_5270 family protein [Thermomonospora umbrina]REF00756.1 hypothetical protein DFJ69_6335 [Thermomonospora umbrina]